MLSDDYDPLVNKDVFTNILMGCVLRQWESMTTNIYEVGIPIQK